MYNTGMSFMGIAINLGTAGFYLIAGHLWLVEYDVVGGTIFFLIGYGASVLMFDWSPAKEA